MNYFTEEFQQIFNGLQTLETNLNNQLDVIYNRINYLEQLQNKDNKFFYDLEQILKTRNQG